MSATKTPPPAPTTPRQYRRTPGSALVGYAIFASRWLQAPLYLGLIVAQAIYVVVFVVELWHLAEEVVTDISHLDEATIMLAVLGLIDVVMIANLLIMVIIGGYETFVSRINIDGHPDQPEWLSHVNANVLKVKLAMAIIGISSIHLLKTFIEVGDLGSSGGAENLTGATYTGEGVMWQVIIHSVFILSALALAWIDRMSYHKVSPHEVHDGTVVPYPDARPGLGTPAAPEFVGTDARH
ncbi:TIGR00645 family protein [Agromyces subbeticus]|uniref:TIGR00645 family protein n=1 Tax=Agromyces subbeticus TaxID=293890 RepID=UPI0003B4FEE8|nr:TIGR00645 family protein [Agromyces subbeticus]